MALVKGGEGYKGSPNVDVPPVDAECVEAGKGAEWAWLSREEEADVLGGQGGGKPSKKQPARVDVELIEPLGVGGGEGDGLSPTVHRNGA